MLKYTKQITALLFVLLTLACSKNAEYLPSANSNLEISEDVNSILNENSPEAPTLAVNEQLPSVLKCTNDIKLHAVNFMKKYDSHGYSIYLRNKSSFLDDAWWTDCTNLKDNLVVALHETVHALTTTIYPLINDRNLTYEEDQNFMKPSTLYSQFGDDRFTELYLKQIPSSTSSATNFSILLDELNAYTNGLNTGNKLYGSKVTHQWRDGVLAMLSYVKAYLNKVKNEDTKTWTQIRDTKRADIVKTLWLQAEKTILNSCGMKNPNTEEKKYVDFLCNPKNNSATSEIIGKAVICPDSCVK